MARQGKTLPARGQNATNDSLLIRSAESLGRMIGSLQRQLDVARHLTGRADGAEFSGDGHPAGRQRSAGATVKRQLKTKSSGASGAGRTRAASDRTSKRAAKSAAKKTARRSQSGAKKRAVKTGRGT